MRNITKQQLNLLDFQDFLIEKAGFDLNDFDQLMIDNIVSNSAYLMCSEDIIALGLLKQTSRRNIVGHSRDCKYQMKLDNLYWFFFYN